VNTYRDELDWAYHGEVYGEAMFAGMADVARDGEQATQLRLMALIERQTRQQLGTLCDREGIERRDEAFEAKGRAFAERADRPNWDHERFLRSFAPITTEALVRYRIMRDDLAPAGDADTMRALVTHEEVLQTLADGLLAGRDDAAGSLVAALEGEHRAEADRLLGKAAPRT
jgi:hypothetical protein